MAYDNIIVEQDSDVAVITLNRPHVLNTLSLELWRELDAAVTQAEHDSGVSVIIFAGKGNRAFSAGADVDEVSNAGDESSPSADEEEHNYGWHIATCAKPTIGAIEGLAYGSGAALASSFDMRVGCQHTVFRFLAASYGRVNSTWSLPLQVGWPIAKELLLTARLVEAREAHRIGFLNHLVACDHLMSKAMELARDISANDPKMVRRIKELVIRGIGAEWRQMYENAVAGDAGTVPKKRARKRC